MSRKHFIFIANQAAGTLRRDEQGKSTVWAMLICVALLGSYVKYGRVYLSEHLSPFFHVIALATVVVVTLFTMGCAINMLLLGDKSDRQQRRDMKRELDALRSFVNDAQQRIDELGNKATSYAHIIRPRSLDSLGEARRIVRALTLRIDEVQQLLSTKRKVDLIDAFELLNSDLSVIENCMESLIGANPIPPLPPEHWMPTVRQRLDQVSLELERIAA